MRSFLANFVALVLLAGPAAAAALDMQAINDAQWRKEKTSKSSFSPTVIKAQVLLDRARFSPGEIDGKQGDNFKKAIRAFATDQGLPSSDVLTEELCLAAHDVADPELRVETDRELRLLERLAIVACLICDLR